MSDGGRRRLEESREVHLPLAVCWPAANAGMCFPVSIKSINGRPGMHTESITLHGVYAYDSRSGRVACDMDRLADAVLDWLDPHCEP